MFERHDNMAANMGSTKRRFLDIFDDEVETLQRKLLEYIKLLQPTVTNLMTASDLPGSRPDLDISTKDGFPWMPALNEDIQQKKDELEKLIRQYLNDHYSEWY
jgi:hypothetical protein